MNQHKLAWIYRMNRIRKPARPNPIILSLSKDAPEHTLGFARFDRLSMMG